MRHFKTLRRMTVLAAPGFPALSTSPANQAAALTTIMTQLAAINPTATGPTIWIHRISLNKRHYSKIGISAVIINVNSY